MIKAWSCERYCLSSPKNVKQGTENSNRVLEEVFGTVLDQVIVSNESGETHLLLWCLHNKCHQLLKASMIRKNGKVMAQ